MNLKKIAEGLRMVADAIDSYPGADVVSSVQPHEVGTVGVPPVASVPPQVVQPTPPQVVEPTPPSPQPSAAVLQHPTVEVQAQDVLQALGTVAQRFNQQKVWDKLGELGVERISAASQDQLRKLLGWAQQMNG